MADVTLQMLCLLRREDAKLSSCVHHNATTESCVHVLLNGHINVHIYFRNLKCSGVQTLYQHQSSDCANRSWTVGHHVVTVNPLYVVYIPSLHWSICNFWYIVTSTVCTYMVVHKWWRPRTIVPAFVLYMYTYRYHMYFKCSKRLHWLSRPSWEALINPLDHHQVVVRVHISVSDSI